MRMFLGFIIIVIVGFAAYVRFAPTDVAGVHAQATPRTAGDYEAAGGFLAVRQVTAAPEVILSTVSQAALATDRTRVLEGTADDGMITFVTRSLVWGFPDYTTVSIIPPGTVDNAGPLVMIDGRLRFGKADLGVNKARIEKWLVALGPLTVPLDSATSAQ